MATVRPLFGGALSCAIPSGFADVSEFRQVPDNQEVFANASTDQCIIIELLQYENQVPDNESARYFFNEIANSNGCNPADVSILHEEILAPTAAPVLTNQHIKSILVGDQRVAKFKESDDAKNTIRIFLANIRLPTVTTDLVISISVPLQINPASSSRDAFQFSNSAEIGTELFKGVLETFSIHDCSLFC